MEHYDALYNKALVRNGVNALPPGVRLIEYDMRIGESPDDVLTQVSNVANQLVIDRSIRKPQEGFGRPIPVEEIREIMCSAGALDYSA